MRTSFYTHRKTLRLKAAIGEAAYWVPPRIWAYAAENQPDGNFEDYTPQEIATFIGYLGDAKKMLQAMLQARFFDENPLKIHDWEEHNGYHEKYAERARNAATARWSKEKSPTPPKEDKEKEKESGDKQCSSNAKTMLVASRENVNGDKFSKMKARINVLYNRLDRRWNYDEESLLMELCRDNGCESDMTVIETYHRQLSTTDRRYFPNSVLTLLQKWPSIVDRVSSGAPPQSSEDAKNIERLIKEWK